MSRRPSVDEHALQLIGDIFAHELALQFMTGAVPPAANEEKEPQPASKAFIDGLQPFALQATVDAQACLVCREDLAIGDGVVLLGDCDCKHPPLFHPQCIRPWLERSDACPQCRWSFSSNVENAE